MENQFSRSGIDGKEIVVTWYECVFRHEDIVRHFHRCEGVGNIGVRHLLQGNVVGSALVIESVFFIGNVRCDVV